MIATSINLLPSFLDHLISSLPGSSLKYLWWSDGNWRSLLNKLNCPCWPKPLYCEVNRGVTPSTVDKLTKAYGPAYHTDVTPLPDKLETVSHEIKMLSKPKKVTYVWLVLVWKELVQIHYQMGHPDGPVNEAQQNQVKYQSIGKGLAGVAPRILNRGIREQSTYYPKTINGIVLAEYMDKNKAL